MTSKISLTRYLVEKQRVHDRIRGGSNGHVDCRTPLPCCYFGSNGPSFFGTGTLRSVT